RLAGLGLDALVAELTALHRPGPADGSPLEEVLEPHLETVYQSGLSCLSQDLLSRLLTQPALLLELQERVLLHRGPDWDEVARSTPSRPPMVERGRQRLPGRSGEPSRTRLAPPMASTSPSPAPWYRTAWAASLATAALVLLAVTAWLWVRPGPAPGAIAWGWQ